MNRGKQIVITGVLLKAILAHCPCHHLEVNKVSFHGASCHLAVFLTVRQFQHTKYSTYQQKRTGS